MNPRRPPAAVTLDVGAPASQVRLAVARTTQGPTGAPVPLTERLLCTFAGPLAFDVDAVSHTRSRLRIRGERRGRVAVWAMRMIGARTARRAVHYTRFGVRTGASTVALAAARRRR